ncbi:MAG: hypothetical protein DRQ44_18300 [Gammaproteobacteria bacterium]|nr:MAG: hypothetical protein DRQ44_18300 [Gammaproteobacteria bacterium]
MQKIIEIVIHLFVTIIFQEIIIKIFGYGTLRIIYTLCRSKRGLNWIDEQSLRERDELHRGLLDTIVGFFTFAITIGLLVWLIT